MSENTICGTWIVDKRSDNKTVMQMPRGELALITIRVTYGAVEAAFVIPGHGPDAIFRAFILQGDSVTARANNALVALRTDNPAAAIGTYEISLPS